MSKDTLPMRLKASALAAALAVLPLAADAAGLGKLTVLSVLGQPLRAELDISASSEELSSLSARMAQPEAFRQAGIEYITALSGVRFSVDKRPDGRPFLRLSSERSINEPFLDMLVELDWASGRLVREYTFLLDPPGFLQKPMAAPAALPEARREVPPEVVTPAAAPVATPLAIPAPAPVDMQPLPPQPSPKPSIAEAKPAPQERVAATTRVVKYGDTLGGIAGETKPEGVSLDQMLVALFRSNEDAFEANNMNRLKAGKILSIPDHEAAAALAQSEARKTVVAQSADFDAYRKRLAAAATTAVPKETLTTQSVSGKIVPRVEDKAPAKVAGKDKLEVSKSESSKDAKADAKAAAGLAGTGRIAAIEEELVARDKALKEANSRIAELERNLNDLKKLVEMKSQGMAELQKQAQAAKPALPAAPVVPEASKTEPVVAPTPIPVKPAEPAKPAAGDAPKAESAAEKPIDQPQPIPPPKPSVPLTPPALINPPPESGFMDDNTALVYGGGIIALLLGYLGFSRWRRRRLAADSGPASRIAPSVPDAGQSVGTSQSSPTADFSQSSTAAIDTDALVGVDPVAEADVYIAHGRDAQAEEILLDALKADPTRHAIRLKLLEIYAARESLGEFETVASELHRQTGGAGPDWEKAAILGQKVDPENPLYGRKPAPAEPAAEPEQPALAVPESEEEGLTLPGEEAQIDEATETQLLAMPVPEELPASLDFDLDLGMPEPAATTLAISASSGLTLEAAEEEDAGLDFELSPGASESASEYSGMQTLVIPGSQTERETESAESLAGIDLDLSESSSPEEPSIAAEDRVMIEPERADEKASQPLDINFFADEVAVAAQPSAAFTQTLQTPPPPTPPAIDFSKISLDLEASPDVESAAQALAEPPVAAFEEVATKLELAHAYEEMGDKEGARELLQEVTNEGNADQQAAARAKLAQLG